MLMRKRLLQLLATLALAWALPAPATELSSITLQPGEYLWMPELAPSGPLVVVISLPQQLGYVYRNGVRIGVTTVSTGKPGFETPAGVYRILQKRREHYSNRYDNAPMPYMQRLTWDGVALHAGRVRKSPASHGCVRLPETFASKLFEVTEHGMTVVIAAGDDGTPFPGQPGFFAPVKATTGTPRERQFSPPQRYHQSPELSPAGPLSVIISSADAQIVVVRNDIEIARSRIELPPGTRFGLHAYVMLEGSADVPDEVVPNRPAHRWLELPLPAHNPVGHQSFDAAAMRAMKLPPLFAASVHDWLTPGSTVIITDDPISPGNNVTVLDATEGTPDSPQP
ncbi:MAG TPA: L,D-transpeptidase family protein [Xanthomonadales bacterium]|nr:L,D-transpeptidase family protein [Xanthomonadales bacterium]